MNKEWFCVETQGGIRIAKDGNTPFELPNQEAAADVARKQITSVGGPLVIVKYAREEVTLFECEVTIKETDVSSASPTA